MENKFHEQSDFEKEYRDKIDRIYSEIRSYLYDTANTSNDVSLISSIDESVRVKLPPIEEGQKEIEVDQKVDVDKKQNLFSLAFFGFNNSEYGAIANDVSRSVLANNNGFKYHINNQDWLLQKIKEAKEKNNYMDLPEVVLFPRGTKFKPELKAMLLDENIPIKAQRVALSNPSSDDLLLDKGSSEYIKSINKLETDIMQIKVDKYVKYYNEIFKKINKTLDELYSLRNIEYNGNKDLYIRTFKGEKYEDQKLPNDIDFLKNDLQIGSNQYLHDGMGNIIYNPKVSIDLLHDKMNMLMAIVMSMYKERDIATFNHINGMVSLVDKMQEGLPFGEKLSQAEVARLKRMVLLHDIGKLVIPDPILDKSNRLTENERAIMKSHVYDRNICLVRDQFINSLLSSAMLHHMGTKNDIGYVDESRKNDTKDKLADMLSVIDVYDALTGVRPYKKSKSPEVAIDIMCEDVFDKKTLSEYYVRRLMDGLGLNQKLLYDKKNANNNPKNINLQQNDNDLNEVKGMGK